LTYRDPEDWFRSINTTLTPLAFMVHRWSWMLKILCFVFYQRTSQIDLLRLLLDQFMRKELLEEKTAARFITKWNDEILTKHNNNILKYNIAEGWEPLCQFLDCSVPQSEFPRLNDSTALVKHRNYLAFLIFLSFSLLFFFLISIVWIFK